MKKSKIADTLYVPIKDGKYLLNGKGIVRVYKSMETLEKYCKGYDVVIEYVSNAHCYTNKDEAIVNERKKWEQEHLYSMLFASNIENETKDMLQTIFRLQEENKELCKKVGNLKKGLATEVKKREIAELKCKKL